MAYVIAVPEMMAAAATDLATIGCNVDAAHMVAAARTTSVIPAAADEVSAGIAQLFAQHAANYQALAGQAAAFQEQFVQNLSASAAWYTSIEDAIASLLQGLNAGVRSGVRSLFNALEYGTFNVAHYALLIWERILLALLPPGDALPLIFISDLFSGLAFFAFLVIIENIAEGTTGLTGLF